MQRKPKLRKREIAFAVAMGGLAAGGAALMLDQAGDEPKLAMAVASHASYQVGPFQKIATSGPQDVIVRAGEGYSVRAEGDPRAIAQLVVTVKDGELTLGPERGFHGNWGRFSGATFYVTVPRLEALSLAGSGSVHVDRVEGDGFSASVAGPGELTLGTMRVGRADFSIAGSGRLSAAGTAQDARVTIAGSGDVDAEDLRSYTASVTIGGSGDAALNVAREARVSIMGSGDVRIDGGARCAVSSMGSGDVRCNGEDVDD